MARGRGFGKHILKALSQGGGGKLKSSSGQPQHEDWIVMKKSVGKGRSWEDGGEPKIFLHYLSNRKEAKKD